MTTRFKNLRRLLTLSGILTPVFIFIAFLCVASGMPAWAVVMGLTAMGVSFAFPFYLIRPAFRLESNSGLASLMQLAALLFFVNWLLQIKEIQSLLLRVDEIDFWDWKLISAVTIWALAHAYANWRTVQGLEDKEIFTYYNR